VNTLKCKYLNLHSLLPSVTTAILPVRSGAASAFFAVPLTLIRTLSLLSAVAAGAASAAGSAIRLRGLSSVVCLRPVNLQKMYQTEYT
jgi:hypothetical protein